MDDFVSARGTGEALGAGEDYSSGIDASRPAYQGSGEGGETFFSGSEMDELDAQIEALENAPPPGEEPAPPPPELSEADKTAAYAAIIFQTTKMIVEPQGAPPPDMADCMSLAKAIVDTEKHFPNVNPVDPKWMAVASLGMAAYGFFQVQRDAIRVANAKDVTPRAEDAAAASQVQH